MSRDTNGHWNISLCQQSLKGIKSSLQLFSVADDGLPAWHFFNELITIIGLRRINCRPTEATVTELKRLVL